ncbi:MAG: hypothetical protein AAF628_01735 [Planctomycetota bacterium]
MLRALLLPCALALFALPVVAQQTWVVAAGGGPGVQFTEFAEAVNVAAAGDTILVRPGAYDPAVITKALTVLGDGGVPQFEFSIAVRGLPAGQRVVLRGLDAPITVIDSAGPVLIDGMRTDTVRDRAVSVIRSAQVSVHDSRLRSPTGITASASNLVLNGVDLEATQLLVPSSHPALVANRSSITVVDSVLRGAPGILQVLPCAQLAATQPAVDLTDSSLVATGPVTELIGGSQESTTFGCSFQAPAIRAFGGAIVLDPAVVETGGIAAPFTTRPIAALVGDTAPPGGVLSWSLHGPVGASAVLLASLPHTPIALPFGALWIDPSLHVALPFGTVPPSGVLDLSLPISAIYPRGTPFAFQGVVLAGSALELTPPLVLVLDGPPVG